MKSVFSRCHSAIARACVLQQCVHFFSVLLFVLLAPSCGRCDLILGNMASFNNDDAPAALTNGGGYSIGFTVGSAPLTLSSVELRLRSTLNLGSAILELRSNVGGNPASSGSPITFNSQQVSTNFSTITFTPNGLMQLSANTTYWLTLGTTVPAGEALHIGSNNPANQPMGPFATYVGLRTGDFNNQTIDPNIVFPGVFLPPNFSIQGTVTAVPEPTSALLSVLGLVAVPCFRKWNRR